MFCQPAAAADVRPDTLSPALGPSRPAPMMLTPKNGGGHALSGRGEFRGDTRSMRMERLHGPKGAHSGPRALSPDGQEKLRQEAPSDIGESGCRGKLPADDRYLCGFGWLARAAWARTAVVIVFRFVRAASTAPASASIEQPVKVRFLVFRTNCASS